MFLIIDAVILAIIALFTFIGYKQGLIKSALKILTFFIAIIVAITLYKPVATLIVNNTEVDDKIQEAITEKILPEGMNEDDEINEETSIKTTIVSTANKTIKEIGQNIAVKIIEVVCFLLLFILTKIVLKFISALSTLITKLPIIKQIDKAGGTIYGLIKGLLIVCVIFAIINVASPLIQNEYIDMINASYIGRILYNYNLLLYLIA